jgi:prepilin-type N-terminal cleavage/methylation domain-containing protein
MTSLRARRGFSFLELMIVIIVAGLMMAIALPKMAPVRDGAGVRSARQVVQAYLATARQTAMRRGGTAQLVVSGNTVSVTSVVGGVTTVVAPPVNVSDQYSTTLTSSAASIQYNSRGLARLVSPGKIKLVRNGSADSVCVTILGMVGRCGL